MYARLVESGGRGVRVRRLGGARAGEIRLTRFLRNEAVSCEAMVAEATGGTAERCVGRRVLVIQDTTVVRSDGGGGLFLHPVLATDEESGAILGLAHAEFMDRTQGKRANRRLRPAEEKESNRWLEGARAAAATCAQAASLTMISDRESDIFPLFARRPPSCDLLIRASADRALDDGGRLFATLDSTEIAGRAELDLSARPGRAARTAKVAARFMTAHIARPRNGLVEDLPKSLPVTFVDIREVDPPAGEAALHWRLITTLPVSNAAEALAVASLYRRRWAIEQLFRTLKTKGFDIEGILIEDPAPLKKLVCATLIAAVTIQQLVHARDGEAGPGPLRPLTDAFEPHDQPLLEAFCAKLQGKTDRQKNPHPKGSLAYAAWVCARLGGWTGYYGKPGPIVMLQGWLYFQAAKHGAALRLAHHDV